MLAAPRGALAAEDLVSRFQAKIVELLKRSVVDFVRAYKTRQGETFLRNRRRRRLTVGLVRVRIARFVGLLPQ